MEKWLILALGQEIYTMNLEHLALPESKEILKRKEKTYNDGSTSKCHRPTERVPHGESWNNLSNKISNIVLD